MSGTTVTVVDKGWSQIQKRIKATGDVYIGLLGAKAAKKYPDGHGLTTAEIGAVHEYGYGITSSRSGGTTIVIPQRSFLRSTILENRDKYPKLLAKAAADGVFKGNPRGALLKVGLVAAGDVKQRIAKGIAPPLAEKTIEARERRFGTASTTPLIATNQMRSAIDAEVRAR